MNPSSVPAIFRASISLSLSVLLFLGCDLGGGTELPSPSQRTDTVAISLPDTILSRDTALKESILFVSRPNGWVANQVLGKDMDGFRLTIRLPSPDRILLVQSTGTDRPEDTLYRGRIAERIGPHWRLDQLEGRLASRNPDGWILIEPHGTGLVVSLHSVPLVPDGIGRLAAGRWRASTSTFLRLGTDSAWLEDSSRNLLESTPFRSFSWPDASTLVSQGIDSSLASWLSGRSAYSLFQDSWIVRQDTHTRWLDLSGDGAFLRFVPAP